MEEKNHPNTIGELRTLRKKIKRIEESRALIKTKSRENVRGQT